MTEFLTTTGVLAERLSRDRAVSVLVLEAGPADGRTVDVSPRVTGARNSATPSVRP
jgi:choline dehydrogenase-like flavoprotein